MALLLGPKQLLEESYNLKHQKATEALEFLVSDTDRMDDVCRVTASSF